jgi:hypothetical protein
MIPSFMIGAVVLARVLFVVALCAVAKNQEPPAAPGEAQRREGREITR